MLFIFTIFLGSALLVSLIAWTTPVNTNEAMARAEAEHGN